MESLARVMLNSVQMYTCKDADTCLNKKPFIKAAQLVHYS